MISNEQDFNEGFDLALKLRDEGRFQDAIEVPVHGVDYAAAISDGVLRPRSAA